MNARRFKTWSACRLSNFRILFGIVERCGECVIINIIITAAELVHIVRRRRTRAQTDNAVCIHSKHDTCRSAAGRVRAMFRGRHGMRRGGGNAVPLGRDVNDNYYSIGGDYTLKCLPGLKLADKSQCQSLEDAIGTTILSPLR